MNQRRMDFLTERKQEELRYINEFNAKDQAHRHRDVVVANFHWNTPNDRDDGDISCLLLWCFSVPIQLLIYSVILMFNETFGDIEDLPSQRDDEVTRVTTRDKIIKLYRYREKNDN